MRYVLVVIFLTLSLLGQVALNPTVSFEASGDVQDLKVYNNKLYAATSSGKVDIFNLDGFTLQRSIGIPKLKDFMGDLMPAKIYSAVKYSL